MPKKTRAYIRSFNGSANKHKCDMCQKIVTEYVDMSQWRWKDKGKFFCCWSCYRKYCRENGLLDFPEKMSQRIKEYNKFVDRQKEIFETKFAAKTQARIKNNKGVVNVKNKKWLKITLGVLAFAAVCVGIFFLLKSLGVTDVEGIRKLVESCGAWGWIVFIALFVVVSTLTCCIPGTSATFIVVSIILFGAWKGFIISTVSVFLSSSLMFFIGDKFGEKAVAKLVGQKELNKAQELIDVKSKIFLPLMFLFPAFPDDALCMVAGMTKMRYWYFALVVAVFRTIGIATICFLGSGFIDWSTLSLIDWFVLINVCVFDIVLIFKLSDKLEKRIKAKKELHKENEAPSESKSVATSEQTKREKRIADLETTRSRVVNNIRKLELTDNLTADDKMRLEMYKKELISIETHLIELDPRLPRFIDKKEILGKQQDKIVERLTNIMKQFYPKAEYSLRRSTTTVSVYLTFSNEFGVKKTIRFSDHAGKKGVTSYRAKQVNSVKNMKAIIDKNMKVLGCKTTYELIEQLKEKKDD